METVPQLKVPSERLEKPVMGSATPGLHGEWFIHYILAAPQEKKTGLDWSGKGSPLYFHSRPFHSMFHTKSAYQSHLLSKGLFLVKFQKSGSNLRPPIVFGCKVSFNGRFESYLADIKLRSLLEFFL